MQAGRQACFVQCVWSKVPGEAKPGGILPTLETGDEEGRPWAQGWEGREEGAERVPDWSSELWAPQEELHRLEEGPQAHQEVAALLLKRDESRDATLRDQEGLET